MKKLILIAIFVVSVFLVGCVQNVQEESNDNELQKNSQGVPIIEVVEEPVEEQEVAEEDLVVEEEEVVEETDGLTLEPEIEEEPETTKSNSVEIIGREGFDPAELTIKKGETVTFVNNFNFGNVLIFKNPNGKGTFSSPTIWQGKTWDRQFDEEGTYEYWTTAFGVFGKIIVE